MKFWITLLISAYFITATFVHPSLAHQKPAVLFDGLGSHRHPVSTSNEQAQHFFDQGLRFIYAFNHDEARRSFQHAAELAPKLAMAHWGMALAVGPNYNVDAEEVQLQEAFGSIQKALALAKEAPEHERAYVEALAKRYAPDPKKADKKKLALFYVQAMRELSQRYPDDLDAATLFAESAMNLRPWQLWSNDGKPAEGTEEIVAVLESVLRRNPDHPGANHYLIHALEASPTPERALAAADRLRSLVPRAGHLVHMPSHIYMRTGDYESAVLANEKAAALDHAYITKFNVQGIYPMMYYSHNLHFLAAAQAMQGRYADAAAAAAKLAAHVGPHAGEMPMLEFFVATPILIDVRFNRWDEILLIKPPEDKLTIVKTLWHYGRGLAQLAKGDLKGSQTELDAMKKLQKAMPEDLKYGPLNLAQKVLAIPSNVLQAKLALAQKDHDLAIKLLHEAVLAEDNLNYTEPADWYIPVRETLGAAYLGMGKAADAEKVFRADLEKHRRNPRSLFGLVESLKAQGQNYAAQSVEQEFQAAWRNAENKSLRVQDW
jgi:tetratricopeptide (TPR) repeat protein